MARALVAILLAVSAVAALAADVPAQPEKYGNNYVNPPSYGGHYNSPCDGDSTTVKAKSPYWSGGGLGLTIGTFRDVTVNCNGDTACVKSGPDDEGCNGIDGGAPGSADGTPLDAGNVIGRREGATLQIGGECYIECDTPVDNDPFAAFTFFRSGWTAGLSSTGSAHTRCAAALAIPAELLASDGCRVVATAVCCKPRHSDY